MLNTNTMQLYLDEREIIESIDNNLKIYFENYYGEEMSGRACSVIYQKDVTQIARERDKDDNDFWGVRIAVDYSKANVSCSGRNIYTYKKDIEAMLEKQKIDEASKKEAEAKDTEINRLQNAIEVLTSDNKNYSDTVVELREELRKMRNTISKKNEDINRFTTTIEKYRESTIEWLNKLEKI